MSILGQEKCTGHTSTSVFIEYTCRCDWHCMAQFQFSIVKPYDCSYTAYTCTLEDWSIMFISHNILSLAILNNKYNASNKVIHSKNDTVDSDKSALTSMEKTSGTDDVYETINLYFNDIFFEYPTPRYGVRDSDSLSPTWPIFLLHCWTCTCMALHSQQYSGLKMGWFQIMLASSVWINIFRQLFDTDMIKIIWY